MEVRLAKTAGFCFGVQKAVDMVYEEVKKQAGGRRIYTYGPIIHNREVVRRFEDLGVGCINTPEEIKEISGSVLIIRSHGVARAIYEIAEENGVEVVDATCPFVKKIHRIVEKESAAGHPVVIIGDRNHPEVEGIIGWSKGPVTVIKDEKEAEDFSAPADQQICIVSQTTFNKDKFQYLVEIITEKMYDTNVINTICNATAARQKEAAELAAESDSMIVIGDPASSNTQKLFEICKSYCEDTYYIQTVKDLSCADLQSSSCVGITAGASTPNYIIQEVLLYVR